MFKKTLILSLILFFLTGLVVSPSVFSQESYKQAKKGWLGVYIDNVEWDMVEALDLESDEGVLISEVVDESPAKKAGLETGDVVISFDKKKVEDVSQFMKLVEKTEPGQRVEIKVIRDGEKKVIFVKIGKRPKEGLHYSIIEKKEGIKPWFYSMRISFMGKVGLKMQDLTEQLGEYFGVKDGEGALITDVDEDGPAQKSGLKAGDVIVGVDGEKIEDTDDVWDIFSEKEEGDRVKIEVLRRHKKRVFTLKIEEDEEWFSRFFPEVPKIVVPKVPRVVVPEKKKLRVQLKEEFEEEALRKKMESLKRELDQFWKKDFRREMEKLKRELNELKEELEELKKEIY